MPSESDLRNPQGFLRSGYYYLCHGQTSITTIKPAASELRVAPWRVPNPITIARIGAEVSTVGEAGSVVRIGVYADDGAGLPGALVLDAGTIDGASGTVQEITGLSTALTPGLYWVGTVQQSCPTTQPTLRAGSVGEYPTLIGSSTIVSSNQGWYGYYRSSTTGALPASFGTPSGTLTTYTPRVFVKTA